MNHVARYKSQTERRSSCAQDVPWIELALSVCSLYFVYNEADVVPGDQTYLHSYFHCLDSFLNFLVILIECNFM